MKPANFPARAEARKIAAEMRTETGCRRMSSSYLGVTARELLEAGTVEQINMRRSQLSKKDRRSLSQYGI